MKKQEKEEVVVQEPNQVQIQEQNVAEAAVTSKKVKNIDKKKKGERRLRLSLQLLWL